MAMIAVGYQAEPDILDGERQQKERAPRTRQPIALQFFSGAWGQPIRL